MTDDSRSGNSSMDSLTEQQEKDIQNIVDVETGNDNRSTEQKWADLWNQDRGIKETFWPDDNPLNDENNKFPFLVHTSELVCEYGSHPRLLRLPRSHGDYLTGKAAVHEDDCIVGEDQNIPFFGVCSSKYHPGKNTLPFVGDVVDTFSGENIILELEDSSGKITNVKGLPCVACIVENWHRTDKNKQLATNESFISGEDGFNRDFKKTCTTKSFLMCKYLGRIKPTGNVGHEVREVTKEGDTPAGYVDEGSLTWNSPTESSE